ncbi:MAG: hydrogenase maturation protease [Actinomycetota bacterium]
MARVRVIGCGNPDAGDDAVGLIAVREARPHLKRVPGVDVVEAGPALNVVHLLEWVDAAVIVDAVWVAGGGRAPGEIVRVDVGNDGILRGAGTSLSSHGFGLAEAVGLAAALGGAPRIVFLGMVAADVAAGRPLSPAVRVALPELASQILAEAQVLSESSCPGLQGENSMPRRYPMQVFHERERRRGALGMHGPIESDTMPVYPTVVGASPAPRIPEDSRACRMTHDEGLRGLGHIHIGKDRGVRPSRHRSEAAWR